MTHEQVVAVLGRGVVDPGAPVAVADDLGLTRGDGCFEATRAVFTADGRWHLVFLDAHLRRMAASASALGIDFPDADAWRALVDEACAAYPIAGAAVCKLVLTRGSENAPAGVLALVSLTETLVSDAPLRVVTLSRGHASDAFVEEPWLLGGVKHLAYAVNVAALREAAAREADDVLFVSTDGFALEGPTSGLIVRVGDELVTTPTGPTGILASITVDAVGAGARASGMVFSERLLTVDEVKAAQGAWLVSSVRGVRAVGVLDGTELPLDPEFTQQLNTWGGF